MVLTIEEKLWAGLLVVLIAFLLFGLFTVHLIDVGKADEKAAVFAIEQKDAQKAAAETAGWNLKLSDATAARAKELADAQDMALKPIATVSLQRYTLSPAVPASPAASGGGAAPAASGSVCSGLVPGSSGEMRSFDEAKSADQLIADYRDLYNSWPISTNTEKPTK
jgi:hypothetical protein